MLDGTTGPGLLIELLVPESLEGERVDKAVALLADLSRSAVNEIVSSGYVSIDGKTVASRSTTLRGGQLLLVRAPEPKGSGLVADPDVEFAVVYEDTEIVVVDKPAGLVVHHGSGHRSGTLVDGLVHRFPDLLQLGRDGVCDPERPGIVHRLDKGTSGLLVVARTAAAYRTLVSQLSDRKAGRKYWAAVLGAPQGDLGEVEAPIGRSVRDPTRMVVSQKGRPARTSYRVLERFNVPEPVTYLEATLHSGRTHQIRVHMSAIGHPVIGDDRYGTERRPPASIAPALQPGRQFLHAHSLTVDHPSKGQTTWESELPRDLVQVLGMLRGTTTG